MCDIDSCMSLYIFREVFDKGYCPMAITVIILCKNNSPNAGAMQLGELKIFASYVFGPLILIFINV